MKSLSTSVNLQEGWLHTFLLCKGRKKPWKSLCSPVQNNQNTRAGVPLSPSSLQPTLTHQELNPELLCSFRHRGKPSQLKWCAHIQYILIKHHDCGWQWCIWCTLSLWLHYFSTSRVTTASFPSRDDPPLHLPKIMPLKVQKNNSKKFITPNRCWQAQFHNIHNKDEKAQGFLSPVHQEIFSCIAGRIINPVFPKLMEKMIYDSREGGE